MYQIDQPGIPYCSIKKPECTPQQGCFIASHVTPGKDFLVNTYLTRPDKLFQVQGPTTALRGYQFNCN